MKGLVLKITSVALWITLAAVTVAQGSTKEYSLWGTMRGSTCPACDNYVEDSVKGQIALEAVPAACPNCDAYHIVSLTAEGRMYSVQLGEGGGFIHFEYGNPTVYLSMDVFVNDYPVSISGEGEYWMTETGWPVLFFPDLASDWFTLSFVAIPWSAPEPCQDNDEDGYGSPASPLCPFPRLDCDDSNPEVNPGVPENCTNGIDDDCDSLADGVDPECWGYSGAANAEASGYGHGSLSGSGVLNQLVLVLIPVGAVILLRIWRGEKQGSSNQL